tara:strand:- start:1000 stop:1185 length:186 start_codon:yes stop_codon:yes gene_type:complete
MSREHWNINKTKNNNEKYQLIYNGNPAHPLCDTREEAEHFKQKAADQWPEIKVEILAVSNT